MTIARTITCLWAGALAIVMFGGLGGEALAETCPPNSPPIYGLIETVYGVSGGLSAFGCPLDAEHDAVAGNSGKGRTQGYERGQITWSPASGNGNGFVSGAFSNQTMGPITVKWTTSTNQSFDNYLIRLDRNGQNIRQDEEPGGTGGTHTFNVTDLGVYQILVEGCDSSITGAHECNSWSNPMMVTIINLPGHAPTAQGGGSGGGSPAPQAGTQCSPKRIVVVPNTPKTAFDIAGTCFKANATVWIRELDDAVPTPFEQDNYVFDGQGAFNVELAAVCSAGIIHFSGSDDNGKTWSAGMDAPCPVSGITTQSFGHAPSNGGALAASGASQSVTYAMPAGADAGFDRPASDIASLQLPKTDPNLCHDACAARADCQAWTYVKPGIRGIAAMCYLKNPAPAEVRDNCCISGKKVTFFQAGNAAAIVAAQNGSASANIDIAKTASKIGISPATPPIAPLKKMGLQGANVTCTTHGGTQQECGQTFDFGFTSNGSPGWTMTLKAPAAHCSSVIYYVSSPQGLIATDPRYGGTHGYPGTGPLAPGQSAQVTFNAAIPAGSQHLAIHAIGVPGGCNGGTLSSWGVEASIAATGAPAASGTSNFHIPKKLFHRPPIEAPR